jgi:hypothetical protein
VGRNPALQQAPKLLVAGNEVMESLWVIKRLDPGKFITSAHLSVSAAMKLAKAAGVIGIGTDPRCDPRLDCGIGKGRVDFLVAACNRLNVSDEIKF